MVTGKVDMRVLNYNKGCRYFLYSRPCKFHKNEKVTCGNCHYYQKIGKRILVIKLDALGDVLRTMSVLPVLKQKYPTSYITWVTRKNALSLFQNVKLVDEVLDYNDPLVTHFLTIVSFDMVINFDTDKSAAALAAFAKAKVKKGFVMNDKALLTADSVHAERWFMMGVDDCLKKKNTKSYQRIIMDILGEKINPPLIPLTLSTTEIACAEQFRNAFDGLKPIVGINVGAGERWPQKMWPLVHYEELIKILLNKNYSIVLYGGPDEKDRLDYLQKKFTKKVISAGHDNPLRTFFSKLSVCDVLVSGDTMAAHAALALGKKLVVLVGPTSASEFEVYGKGKILTSELDCLVCYMTVCDKKPNCMDALRPEKIAQAIKELLD